MQRSDANYVKLDELNELSSCYKKCDNDMLLTIRRTTWQIKDTEILDAINSPLAVLTTSFDPSQLHVDALSS